MQRKHFIDLIRRYFRTHPVVAMLGPRQCGKTTLARMYCQEQAEFPRSNYFDLEAPIDAERLVNPMLALTSLSGLIVVDEIQRIPDLFTTLRVLVDQDEKNKQYLILGSASRDLIRQSSETLAGRIAYLEITPFSFGEVGDLDRLWVRGGFPRSYLAETDSDSFDWREFYIRTFLEQDIPNLGLQIPPVALRRFWSMLAHYHGNTFNASELGRSFGASDVTMRGYLDLLTGTFMMRQLQPWHQNGKKRQVKAPKVYFRDSGILHSLLGIKERGELVIHPKLGASWEGYALEEVIRHAGARSEECYFWSTYGEAEVDLLIHQNGKLKAFEFKYSDAPKLTKSMQVAVEELGLDQLQVIYPGEVDYQLSEKIFVVGIRNYLNRN